ncbi:hypothetical protein ACIQU4_27745 [Streptomyces sp. NPDC090741]|uniref:hypothetical protein n=1 Tax=Streptomyces sp. NPDC090741 TaxID=3365967 RepID=UPI00380340D5
MPTYASRRPTPKEATALKLASVHEHGHLPGDTSTGHIESMLRERWIYGQDSDGFRLELEDALREIDTALFRILPAGRRALLSPTQWRALSQELDSAGRLSDRVTKRTSHCLADLLLVEYRNSNGEIRAAGAGPGFSPHRSELGNQVAVSGTADDS